MKKWNIHMLLMICMVSLVLGQEICSDTPSPNIQCSMVTPSINCSVLDYTIYKNNGSIIEEGNLSSFDTDLYHFNFSQGLGTYIIKLCDDTTREVFVVLGEEEKMIWFTSVFIMVFISILFFYIHHKVTVRERDFIEKGLNKSILVMILKRFSFYYGVIHSLFIPVFLVVFSGNLVLSDFRSWFIIYFVINVIISIFLIFVFAVDLVHSKSTKMASDLMKFKGFGK